MIKKTPISSVGEFGLIEKIKTKIKLGPHTKLGPGDDCAVISPQKGEYLVSTDSLVEGIHFDNTYMSLEHIGYKSVISNVSDIYAMNGNPLHATVSLGISGKYTVEDIENLYSGINRGCANHGVDIIGGDISSSFSGLVVNITVIGSQKKDQIIYRSGANDGDLIVVSGNLGGAYLGLQILLREKDVATKSKHSDGITEDIRVQLKKHQKLVERQIKPEARKDVIDFLRKKSIKPTSMIDISDGLSSELQHISHSSNASLCVYEEKIPISKESLQFCKENSINPTVIALSGGEDYELLFTIKPSDLDKLLNVSDLSIIGKVCSDKKKSTLILSGGEEVDLNSVGWDHFSQKK